PDLPRQAQRPPSVSRVSTTTKEESEAATPPGQPGAFSFVRNTPGNRWCADDASARIARETRSHSPEEDGHRSEHSLCHLSIGPCARAYRIARPDQYAAIYDEQCE